MTCATCRYARPTDQEQRLHCMGPRSWRQYPSCMPHWTTLPVAEQGHWESRIYYTTPDAGEGCPVYKER